ncbi:UPF0481 protein [Acorus calamus]|uniref:UPF0481 protein n=1 Tax=Acorus calamus TaxID=4465 RepID=A0AAV9EY35_ACOCL|nr:UPF0481 protein [Acorus calamus]
MKSLEIEHSVREKSNNIGERHGFTASGQLSSSTKTDPTQDIVLLPDRKIDADSKNDGAIAPAWPIFRSLLADLLLLENQVPFFVLDELFKLLLQSPNDEEKLASDDDDDGGGGGGNTAKYGVGDADPSVPREKHFPSKEGDEHRWARQRGCQACGSSGRPEVKCKPKNYAESFLDVTFHNGVIEIPTLILYPHTQTTLRNIIAFEQCFGAEDNKLTHISHYVIMMAFLIGGTTDISTLQDEEIIINWLGSQEEVLGVFKQLRTEVVDTAYDPFAELYDDVNSYRQVAVEQVSGDLKA